MNVYTLSPLKKLAIIRECIYSARCKRRQSRVFKRNGKPHVALRAKEYAERDMALARKLFNSIEPRTRAALRSARP